MTAPAPWLTFQVYWGLGLIAMILYGLLAWARWLRLPPMPRLQKRWHTTWATKWWALLAFGILLNLDSGETFVLSQHTPTVANAIFAVVPLLLLVGGCLFEWRKTLRARRQPPPSP